jgi:NADH-quinone oxidoreductase subunit E
MVNWEFYDNQTPSSARDLVDGLRAGDPPAPTRGAPLCTFRETARTLAGLPDPRSASSSAANLADAGAATLAGLRVAREQNMRAPAPDDVTKESTPEPEHTEPAAVESTRDEPAPAPSATVPPRQSTTETDPSTTDSDT